MKYLAVLPHHPPSGETLCLGIVWKLVHKIQEKTWWQVPRPAVPMSLSVSHEWYLLFIHRFEDPVFKNIHTLSLFPSIIYRCRKRDGPSVNGNGRWWFLSKGWITQEFLWVVFAAFPEVSQSQKSDLGISLKQSARCCWGGQHCLPWTSFL